MALSLVGTLTACAGGPATPAPSGTAEPSSHEPVIAASEPFTEIVTLEWAGPDGGSAALTAWVADTPQKRALGFMHRTELPEGAGMVFVFPADNSGGFWMKNTLIPLSIAYLSADGEVLAVLEMEPCTADPCPVYDPGVPYRYAVEAGKGWFAARGVGPGWRVEGTLPAAAG